MAMAIHDWWIPFMAGWGHSWPCCCLQGTRLVLFLVVVAVLVSVVVVVLPLGLVIVLVVLACLSSSLSLFNIFNSRPL